MQLITLTQMVGVMVVGAVSMRAAISAISFAGRRYQFARQEKKYVTQFRNVTAQVFNDGTAQKLDKIELSWKGKRKFRVAKRVYENLNQDICSFYLTPYDGRAIPPFRAGQFLTFAVPATDEPEPVTRCYSLSGNPMQDNHYQVTVKRLDAPGEAPDGTPPGKSSTYFHSHLQEGSIVEAYAPAGSFCLEENSAKPVILIAGGVGLTPVVSMLKWLLATGSNREIRLFYGVRNRADHAMYEYLQTAARQVPNLHVTIAYSQPSNTCQQNIDYHVRGHITAELLQPIVETRDCDIYLCGPSPMMSALTKGFAGMGIPKENVRFEAFGPVSRAAAGPPVKQQDTEAGLSFQVEFARSGKMLEWQPRDGSILDLAMANGIKARCACRQGVCGTCAITLQHGNVDYERQPEKAPASGKCLPCIARPQSNLVLDM